jgi:hypothetical protein
VDPGADDVSRWQDLHAAMLDLVLGGGDLEQVAELAAAGAGGTVAVVVPPAGIAVASPPRGLAALRRYASLRLDGDPAPVPDGLELEVPVVAGGEALGMVALLDSPAPARAATEVLHAAAAATVVALAVDGSAAGSERLGSGLLADLLEHPGALPEVEILVRARRAGSDLSHGAIAGSGRPHALPHRVEATVREAFPGALVLHGDGGTHVLLPGRDPELATAAALDLAERLAPFALTPFEPRPERLGAALREAGLAAGVLREGAATAADLHAGSYRLLVRLAAEHPDEVRRFHAGTIGPLTDYDGRHGTEIVDTLRAYVAHDCNMNATATAIFAHRHTVAYRLERVRELTGLDPLRHDGREQLSLGLKAQVLLGC